MPLKITRRAFPKAHTLVTSLRTGIERFSGKSTAISDWPLEAICCNLRGYHYSEWCGWFWGDGWVSASTWRVNYFWNISAVWLSSICMNIYVLKRNTVSGGNPVPPPVWGKKLFSIWICNLLCAIYILLQDWLHHVWGPGKNKNGGLLFKKYSESQDSDRASLSCHIQSPSATPQGMWPSSWSCPWVPILPTFQTQFLVLFLKLVHTVSQFHKATGCVPFEGQTSYWFSVRTWVLTR